ncbi:putative lipid II flippase FtsW [Streptomyces pristinaespiralis]|uniref:putative lipid II flippase FtsW n=1 Tax=Streptomyces pristinaespiralis TaxID=38300 RepID=UPI003832ECAF
MPATEGPSGPAQPAPAPPTGGAGSPPSSPRPFGAPGRPGPLSGHGAGSPDHVTPRSAAGAFRAVAGDGEPAPGLVDVVRAVRGRLAALAPAGPLPAPAGAAGPGIALRSRVGADVRRTPRVRGGGARTPRTPRGDGPRGPRRLYEQARRAWDRPLTAYYLILGSSLLITVLGLVMVYSASMIQALEYSLPASYFFQKQFVAAVIGTVLLLVASRMPVKLHRALSYPLLVITVFLMVLVQVPGIGHAVNGNQNWIYLGGPFQLQPSEFGKLALILWGADLLARKQDRRLLTQWKHLLVPLVPVAFLLLGLIMLGGDMGTAIILTAILFGLLWLAGAPTRLFAGVLGIAGFVGLLLIRTNENRMSRLSCIGAIDLGPEGECWQAVHGIYALASGGWFGSGLGASVEKWGQLPEPHTDFIFAIAGEELGLAGTLSVLALFAALGYAGIRVAGRTEDPFVRYAAGGVTTWITAQAVVNIGAVLGLLPIAGVPLPLFSYGGSALLPTMFAVGLLIAFAREDPAAKAALAVRRPGVRWKTMRRRVKKRPSGER